MSTTVLCTLDLDLVLYICIELKYRSLAGKRPAPENSDRLALAVWGGGGVGAGAANAAKNTASRKSSIRVGQYASNLSQLRLELEQSIAHGFTPEF